MFRGMVSPDNFSSEDQHIVQPYLHVPYSTIRLESRFVVVLQNMYRTCPTQLHTTYGMQSLTHILISASVVGVVKVMVMV